MEVNQKMKMSKKNDYLNELLKGKTAANNSHFKFIFTALIVISTVIRNLLLIKQLFQRDCAKLSDISNKYKYSLISQKELKNKIN